MSWQGGRGRSSHMIVDNNQKVQVHKDLSTLPTGV